MSILYDDYLRKHKSGVAQAYQWIADNVPSLIPLNSQLKIDQHDASKFLKEEYDAYDAYFYGNNQSHAVVEDFNRAWLHHIHCNPHHWQHWVLLEDDPKTGENYVCIPMPLDYILEMICDWWSFSFAAGNLREIFTWYAEHKDIMKLHKHTRTFVEAYLDAISSKLDEIEGIKT